MDERTAADRTKASTAAWHAPLAVAVFRRLWVAQFATNVGMMVQAIAAAWLMTTLTPSPQWIAAVQAAINAPVMLWALVAGLLADRHDRRLVMLYAQALLLLTAGALTLCSLFGVVGPWLLLALTFLIGSAAAIRGPAWNASVVEQVGRDVAPQAVALNAIAFNAARCIGPACGGLIVATWGADAAFAANTVLASLMLAALLSWSRPGQRTTPASARDLIAETARHLRRDGAFRGLLARVWCFGFTGSVLWSLIPVLAQARLSAGVDTFGFMLTAFGAGSVAGSVAVPILRKAPMPLVTVCATALFNLASLLVPVCSEIWQVLPLLALAGLAWVIALAMFNITVQLGVPSRILGRAFALYQMMIFGGMAMGAVIWGAIAEAHGLVAAFAVAAGLGLVSVLLARRPASRS